MRTIAGDVYRTHGRDTGVVRIRLENDRRGKRVLERDLSRGRAATGSQSRSGTSISWGRSLDALKYGTDVPFCGR